MFREIRPNFTLRECINLNIYIMCGGKFLSIFFLITTLAMEV